VTMVKSEECVVVGVTVTSDFPIVGVNSEVGATDVVEIWN